MERATLRLQDKLKACSQDAQGVSLIPPSVSSVKSCCMLPWIYLPPWMTGSLQPHLSVAEEPWRRLLMGVLTAARAAVAIPGRPIRACHDHKPGSQHAPSLRESVVAELLLRGVPCLSGFHATAFLS